MARADKALQRLLSFPKDFSWSELVRVMEHLGYDLKTGAGSSRKFIHGVSRATLMLHEPHPSAILKAYQVKDVVRFLLQENQL